MNTPFVPISWGELIDKITILEIKSIRLKNDASLINVRKELSLLHEKADTEISHRADINALKEALIKVNEALWGIEDRIREKEAAQEFDGDFIDLARSVYKQNDERATIKRKINLALSSELIEEKSYVGR